MHRINLWLILHAKKSVSRRDFDLLSFPFLIFCLCFIFLVSFFSFIFYIFFPFFLSFPFFLLTSYFFPIFGFSIFLLFSLFLFHFTFSSIFLFFSLRHIPSNHCWHISRHFCHFLVSFAWWSSVIKHQNGEFCSSSSGKHSQGKFQLQHNHYLVKSVGWKRCGWNHISQNWRWQCCHAGSRYAGFQRGRPTVFRDLKYM